MNTATRPTKIENYFKLELGSLFILASFLLGIVAIRSVLSDQWPSQNF